MPQEAKIPIRKIEGGLKIETAQTKAESIPDQQAPKLDQESAQETQKQDLLKPQTHTPETVSREKDPRIRFLEDILSEGLEDYWSALPSETQELFKTSGERAALEIDKLLSEDQIEPEEIYEKIIDWLNTSGWSRDFISQEAKRKTDKLIKHGRPISQ